MIRWRCSVSSAGWAALTCHCDLSNLPFLDTIDPEDSYLSWDITLETESGHRR